MNTTDEESIIDRATSPVSAHEPIFLFESYILTSVTNLQDQDPNGCKDDVIQTDF